MPEIITHPSAQALSLFSQGKLSEAQATTVATHLETCADCRKAVAGVPADSFLGKVRAARPSGTVPQAGPAPARPAAAPLANVPPELANHPKFRIIRELGRGGMGVIYLAEHRVLEKQVALKVISPAVLDNPDVLARFHAEARAAAKLDHQNIARAHDADQAGDLHFLVMEFVEGVTLAQLLEQKGPLPIASACRCVRQAALGLHHAFEQGMVHRDIKPQNLMLTPKGMVKVLDFGLARLRNERKAAPRLTQLESFMGTPEYVAPEQATDAREADTRADIYSLGCTLYGLLAGRPPFVEDTVVKMVLAHIEKEPLPLHEVRPDVPPDLSAVVGKMLAKDPAQRYQRPSDVAQCWCRSSRGMASRGWPASHRCRRGWRRQRPGRGLAGTPAARRALARGNRNGSTKHRRPRRRKDRRSATWTRPLWPQPRRRRRRSGKRRSLRRRRGGSHREGANAGQCSRQRVALALVLAGIVIWIKWTDAKGNSTEVHVEVTPNNGAAPPTGRTPSTSKGTAETPKLAPPRADDVVAKVKKVAGIELVPIPKGSFYMGSKADDTDAWDDEKPRHKVTISQPFYLGKFHVTVGQFKRFVDAASYKTEEEKAGLTRTWKDPGFDQTDDHPVVCVSWNDADAFCQWLAKETGANVRLPREAEWEYSCRAGTTTKFYFGDNDADLGDYAWYSGNSGHGTHACGLKKRNDFGLYDMHGLVYEWCADGKRPYKDQEETDPEGPTSAGARRVNRGGSWRDDPRLCRAAFCLDTTPSYRRDDIGFRVFVGNRKIEIKELPPAGKPAEQGFVPLFNGKDLAGWDYLSDHWSVKDGAIIGSSGANGLPFSTFLCSTKRYKDFELSFQVKLTGKGWTGNSGVQIRSEVFDKEHWAVEGPKCDMAGKYWGSLFGEHFGGIMKAAPEAMVKRLVKEDDFNDYYIKCVGKHVTIKLNGEPTIDDDFDKLPAEGVIAWQLHGGPSMDVVFRNIRFTALSKPGQKELPTNGPVPNTLTDEEKASGWKLLFDGKTTEGCAPTGARISQGCGRSLAVPWSPAE